MQKKETLMCHLFLQSHTDLTLQENKVTCSSSVNLRMPMESKEDITTRIRELHFKKDFDPGPQTLFGGCLLVVSVKYHVFV